MVWFENREIWADLENRSKPGGGGHWTKFWGECAAGECQHPPISKGDERTRQAPCQRNWSPWRVGDPSNILSTPMPSQPLQSNLQVVIALLRKYIRCQLPQLSISGYQNRWKYAVWTPVVGTKIKYKTQFYGHFAKSVPICRDSRVFARMKFLQDNLSWLPEINRTFAISSGQFLMNHQLKLESQVNCC